LHDFYKKGAYMVQPNIFQWVILPILIAFSRVCDVTIGTIRIILVSKGNKILSPILGFLEILIWLIAISQIMKNLNNWACYIAYATGFGIGNYIGILLEEKLAMGTLLVRVFTNQEIKPLVDDLQAENHGVTVVEAQGARGKVHMLYIIIQRKYLANVVHQIQVKASKAFYTVEDIRYAREGIFQPRHRSLANRGKMHAK
jgi:uncharacterized protein YebE (UPF0316 family)